MKKKWTIIVSILLFLFLFFGSALYTKEKITNIYNQGKIHMENKEYELALECFNTIGPNWQDSTEWIEKAQKAMNKENGICPYCGQIWK